MGMIGLEGSRWGADPGVSGWPQVSSQDPYKREGGKILGRKGRRH